MVYQSVTGAKDAVVGAVLGGVEKTRMAVAGGINTVMGTRVGQMVSNGVDKALTQSEDWVDQNLPISEKELGECSYTLDTVIWLFNIIIKKFEKSFKLNVKLAKTIQNASEISLGVEYTLSQWKGKEHIPVRKTFLFQFWQQLMSRNEAIGNAVLRKHFTFKSHYCFVTQK